MTKYHLTENGPDKCRATKGNCPFKTEHYDDPAVAQQAYENKMSAENPLDGTRPDPRIREANEFLDFEKNPPVSLEAFDAMLADVMENRERLDNLYAKAGAAGEDLTPEEAAELQELRAASDKAMRESLALHEAEILGLKRAHATVSALNKEAEKDLDFDYDEMIPFIEKIREREEYKNYLREMMDEQKSNLAIATVTQARIDQREMEARGEYTRFAEEEIINGDGEVVGRKTTYFPSGSQEWHDERSKGLGGSDIGYVVGASNAAKKPALQEEDGTWRYLDDVRGYSVGSQAELINKKLETENNWGDHRSLPGTEAFQNAAGRGDAWEEAILVQQMKEYPGEVAYCKSSYASVDDPSMRYNFDGLMLDKETGRPNGVIEIKTASKVDHWGNPADGLDGVPGSYRAQVLHYALNAGFDKGKVVVALNDSEIRSYEFNFNDSPELKVEAEANLAKSKEIVAKIAELKAQGITSYTKPRRINSFSAKQLDPKDLPSKKKLFETAAAYRGVTPAQIEKEYLAASKAGLDDKESQAQALRNLFTNVGPKDKTPANIVGIDLETSGTTPARGRVIEMGVEKIAGGKRVKAMDETFGVGEYARRHDRGVGWEDIRAVHNITKEMVADRPKLKPSRELINSLTKPGTVIMAHNAPFERVWLSSYVPGFNNALRRGKIRMVDSKDLSQWLDDSDANTMNHYGFKWGVYGSLDGEEEHRAYADARDMMDAYQAQRAALRGAGN